MCHKPVRAQGAGAYPRLSYTICASSTLEPFPLSGRSELWTYVLIFYLFDLMNIFDSFFFPITTHDLDENTKFINPKVV